MNVIVIEDNKSIRDMLCAYINAKNHNATCAENGKNGLELIKQKSFDVLLLDLAMPVYSGYDVINDMIKNQLMNKIKVVVLTASSISNNEEKNLLQKGVKQIWRKPIEPNELISGLESLNSV
ncbi:MAG: response regulator transcription factor [Nitrosarchaeum sp.]|nr:response regulator transcription factor [Nitrosarchaeum sp.]